ncbi:X-box-binding protein 1-like [Hydractinia symbiolongicarpus]|uniref:X-box-binding protein 1-like n=1 Tax=Hydractinia symbiolongicarpus TaxID=13093 RepID=UPI0025501496|nr:X-box-binding protein 1-like [Hydractinia symbiolongicarpus]
MLDVSFLKTNIFSLGNVDAKKVLDSLEEDNMNGFGNEQPKKRRRLDDFTPQERMVRRKLKNRVAAQNARDRKKERMDQLENIVSRLEVENKELKRSNEELRTSMHYLSEQNKKLREKLGMDDGKVGNVLEELKTEATFPSKVLTPVVRDYDHIVIRKKEESESEHASLRISLPQKLQILFFSLITIWLTNPRLTSYLTSLDKANQEKALKTMLIKKLELNLRKKYGKKQKSIQALLRMNLVPLFQICLQKKKMNYLNSVRISKVWWGNQTIL